MSPDLLPGDMSRFSATEKVTDLFSSEYLLSFCHMSRLRRSALPPSFQASYEDGRAAENKSVTFPLPFPLFLLGIEILARSLRDTSA
jgi:hypothetical protein